MTDAESGTEAYHKEIGVREGKDGDLFVVTEDREELFTREEALELAGMLIRHADGGFKSNDGRLRFADMELDIHVLPDGIDGERHQLERYEFLDEGLWGWYSNETGAYLEFAFGHREGFER